MLLDVLASRPGSVFSGLAAASTPGMETAWAMFLIVASLLLLFVAMIAVIAFVRRWRRSESSRATPGAASDVDPWEEAGRRTEPYPRHKRKR